MDSADADRDVDLGLRLATALRLDAETCKCLAIDGSKAIWSENPRSAIRASASPNPYALASDDAPRFCAR